MQRNRDKEEQLLQLSSVSQRSAFLQGSPATTGITPMLERSFADVAGGNSGAAVGAKRRFGTKHSVTVALSPLQCGRDKAVAASSAKTNEGAETEPAATTLEKKRRPLSPSSGQASEHSIKRSKSVNEEAAAASGNSKAFEEPAWD
jgi:hypothetical protein